MKNLIFFIILLSLLSITGCSTTKDISLKDIEESMSNSISFDSMKPGDKKTLKRFFGLNADDFEEVLIYQPTSTMDVDELLLIKVKDSSQLDTIENTMDSRVENQIQVFRSYAPKQASILENYIIKVKGDYIIYIVNENSDEILDAFIKSIK